MSAKRYPVFGRLPWPARDVRAEEARLLAQQWARTRLGRIRVVQVVGEPGSGKTMLLSQFARHVRDQGGQVLEGSCVERDPREPGPAFTWVHPGSGAAGGQIGRLLREGGPRGAVIILDDAQWAGNAAEDIVEPLINCSRDTPLLTVLAHRPGLLPPCFQRLLTLEHETGDAHRIDLGPLTESQCAALLGRPATDPVVHRLHQESRGNPFYLRPLADPAAGERTLTQVRTELARLTEPERRIVDAAAVLGEGLTLVTLRALARPDLDEAEFRGLLSGLLRRHVFVVDETTGDLSFSHPMLGRMVYVCADPVSRFALHRDALEILGGHGAMPSALAPHITSTRSAARRPDVDLLVAAAGEAAAEDPGDAAHWLQLALDLIAEHGWAHEDKEALMLSLAEYLSHAGRFAESRRVLQELVPMLSESHEPIHTRAVVLGAFTDFLLGHDVVAHRLLAAQLATLPARLPTALVELVVAAGLVGAAHDDGPGLLLAELAVRCASTANDRIGLAGALALRSLCMADLGRSAEAQAAVHAGTALVDTAADAELAGATIPLCLLVVAQARAGRYTEARRHCARAVELGLKSGHHDLVTALFTSMRAACRRDGDHRRPPHDEFTGIMSALEFVVTGLELALAARPNDQPGWLLPLSRHANCDEPVAHVLVHAHAELADGNPARAIQLMVDAGNGVDLPDLPALLRPASFLLLAQAATELGIDAQTWARCSVTAAVDSGVRPYEGYRYAAQAHRLLAAGNRAGAASAWAKAAKQFASAGLEHTAAYLRNAEAACRPSQITYSVLSASTTATAVPHELYQRFAALTRRERQVAVAARTGKRTREIAAELDISPRTVDVHLTSIYRKLNIQSRTQLASLMVDAAQLSGL